MDDNANRDENQEVIFEDGTVHKFCEGCGECVYCELCCCEKEPNLERED